MSKIASDLKVKGVRFHVEYDQTRQSMKLFGPESTHFAHRGPLMQEFKAPDFWAGYQMAQKIIDQSKVIK